jgi:hypothetical protein
MFRSLARPENQMQRAHNETARKERFSTGSFGPCVLVICVTYGLIKYEQSTLLPALHNCG